MKSGISDYSEIMIYGLKNYFDVSLLTDNYRPENSGLYEDFDVKVYNRDKIDFDSFDHILYNAGNSGDFHLYIYDCALKHPGFIILHDLALYYLTLEYYRGRPDYYSKLYKIAGLKGFFELKQQLKKGKELLHCGPDIAAGAPLNKELLLNSRGVIVHSEYSKNKLSEAFDGLKLLKIDHPHRILTHRRNGSDYLEEKYGIKKEDVILASFGHIWPTKLNHLVCAAVKRINSEEGKKVYYVMLGGGDYIDDQLDSHIIKAGYVDRNIYDDILDRSDIVFNLRYPNMGETSGSLVQALSRGKACFVTDDGWFSELPGNRVIKMDKNATENDIYEKLIYLLKNPLELEDISDSALRYINSRPGLDEDCRNICDFLNKNRNFFPGREEKQRF